MLKLTLFTSVRPKQEKLVSAEYLPLKKYFIPTPNSAQKKAWIWNSTPVPFRQIHIKMCLIINDLDWNSKLSNWILARFAINYTKRYRIKLDFVKRWQKTRFIYTITRCLPLLPCFLFPKTFSPLTKLAHLHECGVVVLWYIPCSIYQAEQEDSH